MQKRIETLDRFVASLTPTPCAFFLAREAERERRHVALFAAASRVLNEASALVGDATEERLARET